MVLSQGIITGQSKCGNGRVTITLAGPRSLWFSFHGSGPVAAGTLSPHLAVPAAARGPASVLRQPVRVQAREHVVQLGEQRRPSRQ